MVSSSILLFVYAVTSLCSPSLAVSVELVGLQGILYWVDIVLGRCSYSSLMSCVLAVSSLIEFVARSRCLLFFEFVSV